MMKYTLGLCMVVVCLSPLACVDPPVPGGVGGGTATIVGQLVADPDTAKRLDAMSIACPDVVVSLNGAPVSVEFDSDCAFAIKDVEASALVEIRVEIPALGVAGTVELTDVLDGELIEIVVQPTADSLTVTVERRVTPEPSDVLPVLIDGNNVSIHLPAGVFEQDLTVNGNRFTLVGEAGENCGDTAGWTVITGWVVVHGNKATFQNVMFEGPVEVRGNKVTFINCCFGDALLVFGNKADINGRSDHPKHDHHHHHHHDHDDHHDH